MNTANVRHRGLSLAAFFAATLLAFVLGGGTSAAFGQEDPERQVSEQDAQAVAATDAASQAVHLPSDEAVVPDGAADMGGVAAGEEGGVDKGDVPTGEEGEPDASATEPQDGWRSTADGWAYYEDGVAATGWRQLGGSWYWFDPVTSGHEASTGFFTPQGYSVSFFADGDGRMQTGWIDGVDGWSFAGAGGALVTGWNELGGSWYYFDPASASHEALTGFFKPAGYLNWFHADDQGRMTRGWTQDADGAWHFAQSSGALATGWNKLGGAWYWFSPEVDANPAATGLFSVRSEQFYADSEGRLKTNAWVDLGGAARLADARGALQDLRAERTAAGAVKLLDASGAPLTGWVAVDGSWLHADASGVVQTGWQQVGGNWYWLDLSSGLMATGWVQPYGAQWYYLDYGGRMLTGWQQVGGNWYWLDTASGVMGTGWVQPYGAQWYYLDPASGVMHEGWLKLGGTYFYLQPGSGRMVTGALWIGGAPYYFNADGALLADGGAMAAAAQGYGSSTGYLIMVDTSAHRVGVFQGSRGNWNLVHYWACGNGKPSTPTVTGTFSTGSKGYYFDSGSARCFYYTQFYGNYLFHSVLYYQDSYPSRVMDGRVGVGVSHGCVRLELSNAKWIYDNIPYGTRVVSY